MVRPHKIRLARPHTARLLLGAVAFLRVLGMDTREAAAESRHPVAISVGVPSAIQDAHGTQGVRVVRRAQEPHSASGADAASGVKGAHQEAQSADPKPKAAAAAHADGGAAPASAAEADKRQGSADLGKIDSDFDALFRAGTVRQAHVPDAPHAQDAQDAEALTLSASDFNDASDEADSAAAPRDEASTTELEEDAPRGHGKHRIKKGSSARGKRALGEGGGGRQPSKYYRMMRDGWHAPLDPGEVPEIAEAAAAGHPFLPLVLAPVNGRARVSALPASADGGFSRDAQLKLARVLTPWPRRRPHPIAPHLLDVVYRAMRHFKAPLVHVVSGYRADRPGSRHTQGRAMDIVLPGVSNEQLAEWARGLGFTGVGVYPKSGFVHIDVRAASFFWTDNSLPDEQCEAKPVMVEEAKLADQRARDRGDKPDLFVPNNQKEDRAAARAYRQRAAQRKAAVLATRASLEK